MNGKIKLLITTSLFFVLCALAISQSSAYENEHFSVYGTINEQDFDAILNPAQSLNIQLDAPITFNITFETMDHDITFDTITIVFKIFGFEIIPIELPIDLCVPAGTSQNFNQTMDMGEFLEFNDFSLISGQFEIGLCVSYTVDDTGESHEVTEDLFLQIGDSTSIFTSVSGLITLSTVGGVAISSAISPPKSTGGAVKFGTKSSTSGYLLGQQMGFLPLNLPMLIVIIVSVTVLCGIVGYFLLKNKKKKAKKCVKVNGEKYCKK
jgi:hypothetical protein